MARQAWPDFAGDNDAVLGRRANLKYIVLAWAAAAMAYSTKSGVGPAGRGRDRHRCIGAVYASVRMTLDRAANVIPLWHWHGAGGDPDGVHQSPVGRRVPFLILLGALGGYLVVPMNALLQHRGHMLMGAGRSIAVQNFNEQTAILAFGGFYAGMTAVGLGLRRDHAVRFAGGRHDVIWYVAVTSST